MFSKAHYYPFIEAKEPQIEKRDRIQRVLPEIDSTELTDLDLDCQSRLEALVAECCANDNNAYHAHE